MSFAGSLSDTVTYQKSFMSFTGSLIDTATYFVRQQFHIFHRKLELHSDESCQAKVSYISQGA